MSRPDRSKIRRVLMTTDTLGGVWNYAVDLTRALSRQGIEVILATMGAPPSPALREQISRLPRVELRESRYRLEWMEDPWDDVARAGDWLLRLETKLRPDIVHLNGYAHGTLPWRAPALVTGHSCVLSWWAAVRKQEAPAEWDRYREHVAAGLRGASLITTPTQAMLEDLRRIYGAPRAWRVIPNGRELDHFGPARKEPVVFAAGRLWDEAKNIRALDRVAFHLPWPVYVAGDNRHPDGGGFHAANVRPLGWLSSSQLAQWYARSSIYALPAKYEPFGLTVLEAAMSECALVLGDIPSLRENWDGAALFVPPDDHLALGAALVDLIGNPSLRLELARRARARAARFTVASMAEAYLDTYRWLLREHRPAGQAEKESAIAALN